MSEKRKQMLAQALREYPTWGDAYIAEKERNEALAADVKDLLGCWALADDDAFYIKALALFLRLFGKAPDPYYRNDDHDPRKDAATMLEP